MAFKFKDGVIVAVDSRASQGTYITYILIFSLNSVISQDIEKPQDKVSYQVSIDQNNCAAYIIVSVQIIDNWHINAANLPIESFSIPTQINLDLSDNFTLIASYATSLSDPSDVEGISISSNSFGAALLYKF